MFTLTLLPRVAVSSLLAIKISCGAGEDVGETLDVSTTDIEVSSSTATATTPPTSTEDPSSVTEVGSTGPASSTSESTGVLTGSDTGVLSTGDVTDTFGESSGGGMLPAGQCRSDADCDVNNFESCYSADDPYCGPCQVDQMQCLADRDCGEGVCELVPIECGCNGPVDHVCVPKCAGPADCEEGKACDLETGRCEFVTCSEGATCAPLFDCVPDAGGDDCLRRGCEDDMQCDGGVCVEGKCFEVYGECKLPGV